MEDTRMRKMIACATIMMFFSVALSVFVGPVVGDTHSRADLTVGDNEIDYTVSGTETYDNVFILEGGNLIIPSGATLNAKEIELQGGAFKCNGGTVTVDRSGDGNSVDARIGGQGKAFEMRNGCTITLKGADAGTTHAVSQGGNAKLTIKVTDQVVVDGATVTATAGHGYMRSTAWFDGTSLDDWSSAGGSAEIKLLTNRTPHSFADINNADFTVTGGNAASAANAGNGAVNVAGRGGGYVTNAAVSGYVGAGGYGNITVDSTMVELNNSHFIGNGGNGGDAGNGGKGGLGTNYNTPAGGGGGGGYAGGSGGLYTGNAGKSGSASGYVGSGGQVQICVYADYMNVTNFEIDAQGGNAGNAGDGGNGAEGITTYYQLYSGAGGGGGYGGGGGGAYYGKSGGSGSASDYVGKGGSVLIKIIAEKYLKVDGLDIDADGGNGGNGGNGGQGTQVAQYYYYAYGGGAGGLGGGGGGGYYTNPGGGNAMGEVASGGNVTVMIISSEYLEVINTQLVLNGGDGGSGGNGGKGGVAGGGGGGLSGGGGMGYQYNQNKGGKGSVSDFVGMGGSVTITFRGIENLVVIENVVTATGGKGGDSGNGGGAGSAGGGGGGIGGGGGTYNGQGGESALQGRPCDGGDVTLTVESKMPSVATSNTFQLTGGTRGNGLTKPGSGGASGGSGKGRSTKDGLVKMFIPMSIPHPLEPEEGALLEGDVTFKWSKSFPAWDGARERKVQYIHLQIDNNSNFKSPDYDNDKIDPNVDSYTALKDDLIGGLVYWRLKAIYDIGTTDWSEDRTFMHNIEPELIKEIPSVKLDEDQNKIKFIDLNDYFTDDLYANRLNYTILSQEKPDKVLVEVEGDVAVEGKHFLSFYTVENNWYGSSQVQIKATDRNFLYNVSNKFTVTVVPINDAPFVLDIPDQTVTEDKETVLDLAPYITDVDNPLSQLTLQTDSSYIKTNDLNITMFYTYGALMWEEVTVTVSDLRLNAYAKFNVSITPVNDKPVIKKIPDRTMEEDSPLEFLLTPYGKDEEDSPEQLDWTCVGGPLVQCNVDSENNLRLSSLEDESGTDTITLTVTDLNGASTSTTVTVVVLPVNDPPTFADIEDQNWAVDNTYEKNLESYITDVDNMPSELILTSDSQFVISVVGFTVNIAYPLDTVLDMDEITFTVSDGIDTTTKKMTVNLKKPPRFVNPIPDMSLEQGETESIDLRIFAVDDTDDENALNWSVVNRDKNLVSIKIQNKNLIVKAGTSKSGATTIKVKVTDTEGFEAEQDVRITVKESEGGSSIVTSGDNLLIPMLLILVLIAMVGMTVGYKYKLRRDRMKRVKMAREARLRRQEAKMEAAGGVSTSGTVLHADEDKLETATTGPSAVQLARLQRVAPLCFACGTKTKPDERGRFICPKCGRMSN